MLRPHDIVGRIAILTLGMAFAVGAQTPPAKSAPQAPGKGAPAAAAPAKAPAKAQAAPAKAPAPAKAAPAAKPAPAKPKAPAAQKPAKPPEKPAEEAKKEDHPESVLAGVSSAMPSLMEAYKISSRVAHVGFDWPNIEGLFEKLHEET